MYFVVHTETQQRRSREGGRLKKPDRPGREILDSVTRTGGMSRFFQNIQRPENGSKSSTGPV